jgi:hypothetical protein
VEGGEQIFGGDAEGGGGGDGPASGVDAGGRLGEVDFAELLERDAGGGA